jgi:formiminoglutamase
MTDDPRWPRASAWLAQGSPEPRLMVLGVPAHETSISPTQAHLTPAAVRQALQRYSTHSLEHDVDLADLPVLDAGDVSDPDHVDGESRVAEAIRSLPKNELLIALGGDNSITHSVMSGLLPDLSSAGLITLDAHYDLRDGVSNGSPVRRLIEAGLPGSRVVQIGIADFSNSAEYASRARDLGITVIPRRALRRRPIEDVMAEALDIAGAAPEGVYVDIDVDVCDRSVVPACPAAAPGGLSADELRRAAHAAGTDPRVRGIDFTEVDTQADAPDGRTVRLVALALLEAASGLMMRTATSRRCDDDG